MTSPVTDASPSGWDAWITPGRFAALLGLLIFAMFPDVLLGTRTFVFRDFGLYSYPVAHHVRESFWRGEMPLWNPLNNCGIPFFAQWSTMALYPPFLFCVLFPLSWSLGVFCLLHLVWAGLGMYFLAHRWTGSRFGAAAAGLVFVFNGIMLSCLIWPYYVAVISWSPFVWLATERAWREGGRWIPLAALAGAMQMLAGIPEIILLTWLTLAALLAVELFAGTGPRALWLGRCLLVIALVTALGAVQIFPFLDFLPHSHRDSGYAGGEWAMPGTGWANFLVPLFLCYETSTGVFMQHNQGVVSSYYQGIGVAVLAVSAVWLAPERRVRVLAALTLLCVVLAMGPDGAVYSWLRKVFPPLGLMRYPVKFVFLVLFTAPLLCAFALRALAAGDAAAQRRRWRVPVALAAAAGLLIAGLLLYVNHFPQEASDRVATLWNGVTRAVLLALMLGALWRVLRAPAGRPQMFAVAVFLLLLWADLATHVPRQNPTTSRDLFDTQLPPLQALRPAPRPGEARAMLRGSAILQFSEKMLKDPFNTFLLQRLGLFADTNLPEGLAKVDGFYSLFLRREHEVFPRVFGYTNTINEPLADFLGVAQVTSTTNIFAWTARTNFMPLITAGQRVVFADGTNTLAALESPNFNPRAVVFLPPAARVSFTATNATAAQVTMKSFAAHRIECDVTATQPAVLVIAQANYPAWKARVNGTLVPLWHANHAFQAVPVPAGTSRVTLTYEDRAYTLGKWLSLLAFVGCAAACVRRRPPAVPPAPV